MTKKNVLILGANGQVAHHVIKMLSEDPNVQLTLFLRKKRKLKEAEKSHARVIEGDVLNHKVLKEAMRGQNIVYANLAGEMDKMAKHIVKVMMETGVRRLIFIASLGIYDEVPGEFGNWNKNMIGEYLPSYRKAADIIETSDLEYTIIRPAWMTDNDEIDYEITQKEKPFKGTEVSRKSIAALIVKLIQHPKSEIYKSIGVNKPHTDGDKPAFY